MAKELDPESLKKLEKLTKLIKKDKVNIEEKKITLRRGNKWRSTDPKFAPKAPKAENTVQAGGMDVDPALAREYENWRKDKIEEQNNFRIQQERKAKAAREKAEAERRAFEEQNPDK